MYLRLFRHFIPLPTMVMLSLDTLFILSLLLWMITRSASSGLEDVNVASLAASPLALFWLIAVITMISVGLYAWEVFLDFGVLVSRISIAFGLILLSSYVLAAYNYRPANVNSMPNPAFIWLTWIALTRSLLAVSFSLGWFKRRILVLGSGSQVNRIIDLVHTSQNHHFVPVSYVQPTVQGACNGRDKIEGSEGDSLPELATRLGISEIVVATSERRGLPVRELLHCKLSGIKVIEFLDFWERETRSIDLEALTPSWLFYSDGFRLGVFDETIKRALDLIASLGLFAFTLPLQLVTAGLIVFESRGPILYRQERVGRHGQVFTMLKFRSMRMDAEADGRARWAAEADPRITRIGRLIRKYRIDELPQLSNVLRGDMSFVGPRPERPYFVDRLSQAIPYYAERHSVRPGITGWAQINCSYGASVEDARRKLGFDLYYVKNRSLFLDFHILLKTARVVFTRSGAR